MTSSICTLYEGHYHFGVGALVNSLYKNGFRGNVWAGYRGELPPWATNLISGTGFQEFTVADGCAIRFIPLDTKFHFTNYKPTFMRTLWRDFDPDMGALFYFDPDIVLKCHWKFFEDWVQCGVALVQEITSSNMPSDHPVRFAWKRTLEAMGVPVGRELNQLFNGGFIGVRSDRQSSVELWEAVLAKFSDSSVNLEQFSLNDPTSPYNVPDQMALNVMAMATEHPLSTIGPEGMDFCSGGMVMSHATSAPKPWRKDYIRSALQGIPPSPAEKEHWKHVSDPIALYPQGAIVRQLKRMKIASAFGRLVRRA